MKNKTFLLATFIAIFLVNEAAFARAGGRSSGFGGSRGSSYSNMGSRGSRTYDGGKSNGQNYSGMNKSTTPANQNNQGQNNQANGAANQNNPNFAQQNSQPSFFQRNPMMSTFGAAIAGTWIGNMLFGSNHNAMAGGGVDANGNPVTNADSKESGGGMFSGMLPIILIGLLIFFLVRRITKKQSSDQSDQGGFGQNNNPNSGQNFGQNNFANNNSGAQSQNITLAESEKGVFAHILIEVQSAWSNQDMERLKKSVTPEILKYFSDALRQNQSQNLQNKVENLQVESVVISESWQEEDMQFATVILEWSALDYNINIEDTSLVDGNKDYPNRSSEAWTLARYQTDGKWILSAIAQID